MADESIKKLTVYKLAPVLLKLTNIPGYKLVADGKWNYKRNDYAYRLFFHKEGPHPPSWLAVFNSLHLALNKRDKPQTMSSGFILLLEVDSVLFGITGGTGHIHLRNSLTIENRFGIDLAERILGLPELRGLTQRDTSGVVNSLDRAFRGVYNPEGDINNLKRVLTHVRGTLQKTNPLQATIGRSIQASDALTVNGRKTFEDIIRFLIEVNKLIARGKTQLRIPQLQRIDKKTHATLLDHLEIQLTRTLLKYKPDDTHSLFLDNEDIGYLPDRVVKYDLLFKRKKYECETFVDVFQTVRTLLSAMTSIEDRHQALRRMNLKITFDDETTQSQSLLDFICGDLTYKGDVYFINNKKWYRANQDFIRIMTRELDNIECINPDKIGLSEWDKSRFDEEEDFNLGQRDFVVMDRQCALVPNEKGPIEFCDLLKVSTDRVLLVHVKHDTGAALRALFAQGFVSARLYAESDSFRSKVHEGDLKMTHGGFTAKELSILKGLEKRHRREMRVVFAIFDDKPTHTVPPAAVNSSAILKGALTTFATVDLLDRATNIRALGYDVALCRIKPYPTVKRKSSRTP